MEHSEDRDLNVPSETAEKTRRNLVREAAKIPTARLKELQEFLASTDCVLRVTTIFFNLHMSGLWGTVARWKPFFIKRKNIRGWLNFAKAYIKAWKRTVFWSDETEVKLFGQNSKRFVYHKTDTVHHLNGTVSALFFGTAFLKLELRP